MEEYKVCFEDYEISNFGNCRRKQKDGTYKEIKGSLLKTGGGYRYFQIQRDGKRINKLFHHLVAQEFIGERPEGLEIDHKDRNPTNNNVNNLRYITHEQNCRNVDRYRTDRPEDKKERRRLARLEYERKEETKKKKKEYARKWYLKKKGVPPI